MGERFRQAREALGLTQTELGAAAKVSQDGISRFESGSRGLQLDHFVRLIQHAARHGVDVRFVVLGPVQQAAQEQPSAADKARLRTEQAREAREALARESGDEQADEATRRVRKPKRARAR